MERLADAKQIVQGRLDVEIEPMLSVARRTGTQLWEGDLYFIVYLAIVIITSYFTFTFIEKPGRDWVRRRVLKS